MGGIDMEELELEEGEACSYNITNDYGGSEDPDIDLSYIDEKLQNILGHFQKDFEGGVFAENLGAKYGGYGSFLPTYQRSPVGSHPRTPAKPQSSTGIRSPNNLQGESQSVNAASPIVHKMAKSGPASSGKPKKSMKSKKLNYTENSNSRHASATKKPGVFSKQNSLKLRIKMGSDNISADKNAAIYSGLGLDASPSLSLDNSLSGSEGMNGEPHYSPLESPASILMIMTTLPVDGELLSPLSDDLIRFIEGGKAEKEYKCISPYRLVTESSSAIASGLEPKKVGVMPSVEKKRKVAERNSLSAGTNARSKKVLLDGTDTTVKEPTTSYPTAVVKETATSKLIDASKESCNGTVRGELVGDGERRSWGLTHHKDLEPLENPKTSSAGSVREDKKARSSDNASGSSRKIGKYKGNKSSGSVKKESSASKMKSGHKTESELYSRKQKSNQIDTSDEQDGTKFFKEQEPQSSSGGKTKFKEQRSTVVTETKMNGQADFQSKKKEVVALKPQNDGKKVEDTYKDFFGDMGDSEEEEQHCSLEVKDFGVSEKGLPPLEDMPEKSSFPLTDFENVGPPISTKFTSDASLPKSNPVIIQEHWVACDKCGKWRLLPFGVFPEDLPEKWMCTMLNWLPGVNYCNVPEDETTKALYAMYQIPVPESQAPMQNNLSGLKPQFNQADDSIKKKKKGLKKIENGMDKEGVRTAETNKKTVQASARNGGIHNAHANISQSDFGRLSDLTDERQKQKQKGKAVDHHSDGGELKSLKMNNKRHADRESSVLTKKMKIENFLFPDEDQGSERPSSSSGVPAAPADNDRRKFTNPLKESQSDKKHKPQVSSKLPKEEGASDTGNSDITGANKKRKMRESHSSQVYKELSENENRERKKARGLYEEREPSFSQGNGKSEKKNRSHPKREHGHVHNSVMATSSSSKISDSHKAKNISHEAKCSPVESVSSSPMRTSNPEKSSSARRKKEESYDANVFAAGSLRRYSDGEEDGGSDRSQAQMKDKHGFHETSVLDMWDKESLKAEPSLDTKRYDFENGGHKDLPRKLDRTQGEGKQPSDHRHSNGSLLKKSGKSSSSRSKDKNLSMRSDSQEGSRHIEKKMYDGKLSRGSTKPEGQTDVGAHCSPDTRVGVARPNIPKPHDGERVSERSNRADIAFDRDASQSRPPSRGVQNEAVWDSSARKKAEKCGTSAGNSIQADDVTKATTQIRKKSEPSPSPLRKELTSAQAAHVTLKEAKDLKHTADRLKNDVSNIEHIELYFQACLKFLHGAFLLEMSSNESARQGETMVQCMKIYGSTANLCGFCAHEYEKSKDMGAAALAYKCMEAAYMRVVNSSYTSANRYRNELQTSLQMVPPGESPSSSASDVDNVNHPAAADRVGISKGINSPLVAGNHVISAQNRSNILRLLQFSQDVTLAMDASRKSRVALASSIENLGEAEQQGEGIVSIKSALDFNFQDMEGLLRLVKLAMKANNR